MTVTKQPKSENGIFCDGAVPGGLFPTFALFGFEEVVSSQKIEEATLLSRTAVAQGTC